MSRPLLRAAEPHERLIDPGTRVELELTDPLNLAPLRGSGTDTVSTTGDLHALYIDGHLIEAKTLVNGVTVIVEKTTRYVTYHHIELANHDVVLAEGLPAETYLESGNRLMFESDAQPMVLHPDFAAASRKNACAPLLTDGRIVTAARQRLLDRALALGFAVTGDVDLVVRAGLERIKPEPEMDGELLFVLPAGAKNVQLISGTGVPA